MPRPSLLARRSAAALVRPRRDLVRALVESEARYRQAVAATDLGMWDFDVATEMTFLDERAQSLFGFDRERVPAAELSARVHPEDQAGFLEAKAGSLEPTSNGTFDHTHRIVHPGGSVRWVHAHAQVLFADEGGARHPVRVIGSAADVTSRVRDELALRESEALLRQVIDNQLGFVGILDVTGNVLDVNHAALAAAGLSRADVAGRPFWDCPWWCYDASVAARIRRAVRAAATGTTSRFDVVAWISHEGRLNVDFQVTPVYQHDGSIRYLIPSGMDVTERRLAEAALQRLNETLEQRVAERTQQVSELSRALTLAEQEERRRIAYVLHEDLQQLLAAAGTLADLGDTPRVRALIDRSLAITRTLSHDLAPPLLDNEDLRGLLEWLVHKSAERHGLRVALDIQDPIDIPEAALRALIYQVLREVLFNVVKHAGTLLASLTAKDVGDHIQIEIEDEGAGFDAVGEATGSGLGLASVRERLERVGGRCTVASELGAGTRVTILVPSSPSTFQFPQAR